MPIHAFTSITCNYLPKARVLAESLKTFHPEIVLHLVLVDTPPFWLQMEDEKFDSLLRLGDLVLRNPEQWVFQHSVVEACTGIKGFALEKLLRRPDCSGVLYFDPDIVLFSRLDGLLAELDRASVLVTPHLTEPETTLEGIKDNEFAALQHGIYNLGFLGVKNTAEGRRFAAWWKHRLEHFCFDDIPRGIFTDQRWVDLAPAYFEDIRIVRDPEYNVCTWNLTSRKIEGDLSRGITVNGRPLAFYHFSGLDSGAHAAMLEKYGSRTPALRELFEWYLARCDLAGQTEMEALPWSYSFFDNGKPVTAAHRRLYREREDLQQAFPNPYFTADANRSYYHWFEAEQTPRAAPARPRRAQAAAVPESSPPPPPDTAHARPEHVVFLSVCGASEEEALQAARDAASKSYAAGPLRLAGPQGLLAVLLGDDSLAGRFLPRPMADDATHEDAFKAALAESAGKADVAFATPSTLLCDAWDLRLAWTLQRARGAATVSPINDGSPSTYLGLTGREVQEMDAACYHNSLFFQPEIPAFLPSCVYVNREAIREAGPARPDEFLHRTIRLRWTHILADHLWTGARKPLDAPPAPSEVPAALEMLRLSVQRDSSRSHSHPLEQAARRNLHVMHNWGGGLEAWIADYCRADRNHRNFVLKSIGSYSAFGRELWLFPSFDASEPVRRWILDPPLTHTAETHRGYRAVLAEIIDSFGIDSIIVSSLIGHSLDVYRTGLRTISVCHDYYPFCPALNITFGSVCTACGHGELSRCTLENPHHRFFRNVPPAEWESLRRSFVSAVTANHATLVAPSPSVRRHYLQFLPDLEPHFRVIPHGTRPISEAPLSLDFQPKNRLRVIVLGHLAPHKGLDLLRAMMDGLLRIADLYLLGCGQWGAGLDRPGVTVLPEYRREELPDLLRSIAPHVGLLLSVVPETFSYTLQELFEMGIPPLATRIGSFADRIQDGETGFLADPSAESVLARLQWLEAHREELEAVHRRLRELPRRSVEEMLEDYEAVLQLPSLSPNAYFAPLEPQSGADQAPTRLQLLWRAQGAEFSEDCSSVVYSSGSQETRLAVLPVPRQSAPVEALRLDFSSDTRLLLLFRLRLSSGKGEPAWSWNSRDGVLQPSSASDVMLLGGGQGTLVYVSGTNPNVVLPVPADALASLRDGGALEIEFSIPGADQALARMANAILEGSLAALSGAERQSVLQYLSEQVRTRSGSAGREMQVRRLIQQLTEARDRVRDLEQSLSWRITAPLRAAASSLMPGAHRLLMRWRRRRLLSK